MLILLTILQNWGKKTILKMGGKRKRRVWVWKRHSRYRNKSSLSLRFVWNLPNVNVFMFPFCFANISGWNLKSAAYWFWNLKWVLSVFMWHGLLLPIPIQVTIVFKAIECIFEAFHCSTVLECTKSPLTSEGHGKVYSGGVWVWCLCGGNGEQGIVASLDSLPCSNSVGQTETIAGVRIAKYWGNSVGPRHHLSIFLHTCCLTLYPVDCVLLLIPASGVSWVSNYCRDIWITPDVLPLHRGLWDVHQKFRWSKNSTTEECTVGV